MGYEPEILANPDEPRFAPQVTLLMIWQVFCDYGRHQRLDRALNQVMPF